MKATIKQYLLLNPGLVGQLNADIDNLLKNSKLRTSKIISINVHNYLMQTELRSRKKEGS